MVSSDERRQRRALRSKLKFEWIAGAGSVIGIEINTYHHNETHLHGSPDDRYTCT